MDRISAEKEFQLSSELEQWICQHKPNYKDLLVKTWDGRDFVPLRNVKNVVDRV